MPSQVGGVSSYADTFRSVLREAMFVSDEGDIPEEEKVTRVLPCSLSHPGICRTRDRARYRRLGALRSRLHRVIMDARAFDIGDVVEVESLNREGEVLVSMCALIASLRYRDPVLVIFILLQKHADLTMDFTIEEDCQSTIYLLF